MGIIFYFWYLTLFVGGMMVEKFREIQYDSDYKTEYSYSANDNSAMALSIKNRLFESFAKETDIDLSFSHDMLSYHTKNDTTYKEDSIVVVYSETCPFYLLEEFGIKKFNSLDFYVIKYYLDSKRRVLKTYDADMYKYEIPQLPHKSAIGSQFGVGRTHGLDKEYRDVYFFNSNDVMVDYFYGDRVPKIEEPYENPATKCYGITYEEGEKDVLKVKRYLFPFHLEMTDLSCL